MKQQRPIGVTILAIIDGIQALLLSLMGIAAFFVGQIIIEEMQTDPDLSNALDQLPPGVPDLFPKVLGGIFLAIALANVLMAVGLWLLHTWAWYLNLVLQGLGIFGNLGGLLLLNPISLVSIAFSGFFIYYFLQDPIQKAFGVRNAF